MNTSTPTEWHVGGTCAPHWCNPSGRRTRIWVGQPRSVVPDRATVNARVNGKPQVRLTFIGFFGRSGTKWHGSSLQSIRDLGRTQ